MKSDDHIFRTWEKQATEFGEDHSASWGDIFAIQLEVDFLKKYLNDGDIVLDVGCANGYSSFELSSCQKNLDFSAVDFSPKMIEYAEERASRENSDIKFQVANIKDLPFQESTFDVVFTTRVLINLSTWQEQMQGIEECIRICKPGGKVLLLEAFWEPLCRLNALRIIGGLEPLIEHDFNRYLKEEKLRGFLDNLGIKHNLFSHTSCYYLGTRFLRELVNESELVKEFRNPFNESFFELEKGYDIGDFGIQKAVVLDI